MSDDCYPREAESLRGVQEAFERFERERGWDRLPVADVYIHLIEELSEIGRYILYEDGYKKEGLGHDGDEEKLELEREFAQAFSLFLQLANHFDVDLQSAWKREMEVMAMRFNAEEWREYVDGIFEE